MAPDDLINKNLGPYLITAQLGKGGMATVYQARQPSMERDVAIKVMIRELADDPQFVDRFEHEAQMIANLQHPHILPVIDFGRDGQHIYIVMQLVRGGSLDDRLKRGPLPIKLANRMLGQIASALAFAHEQGIVHRDLKPNNVLLDERDNTYLTDFGIAKMLAGATKLTATGHILGTPSYMAPEQWQAGTVDARTDIYSLGVMTYEMVVGRLPFAGDTPYTLMFQHVNEAPPPPRQVMPALRPGVEAVILRALSKDPSDRFQSAEQMAEDFDAAVRTDATPAGPVSPDLERTALGTISTPSRATPPTVGAPGSVASAASGSAASDAAPTIIEPEHAVPPTKAARTKAAPGEASAAAPAAPATTATAPRRSRGLWALLGVIAMMVIGGGIFALISSGGDEEKSTPAAVLPTETATELPSATPEPSATPTITPSNTPEPTATPRTTYATVLSQLVNVRSGPDTGYSAIATLNRDDEVVVIGVSEDNGWYQIAIPGAGVGWVSAELVRISGNPTIPVVVVPTATATASATNTPEPTATATATPTTIPSDTPAATATPTTIPSDTAEPTAAVDASLFVPASYSRVALDDLNLSFDYPDSWVPLFYSDYSRYASLAPLDEIDIDHYPWMRITRGSPQALLDNGFTDDISSPGAAVNGAYALSGAHTVNTDTTYPVYQVVRMTDEWRYWADLIVVSETDWVMVLALAPTYTGQADAFGSETRTHIINSLEIDGIPLVGGTVTIPSPTAVATTAATSATPSGIRPDLFAPAAFRRAELAELGIMLDRPSAWPSPQHIGSAYVLRPVAPNSLQRNDYPAVVIARGEPAALLKAETTTDTSSPQAALEHTLGLDLSGQATANTEFNVPGYVINRLEPDRRIWSALLVLGDNDWLHIIAIVPVNDMTDSFFERTLLPMVSGLTVDGQPIMRGSTTAITQTATPPPPPPTPTAVLPNTPVVIGPAPTHTPGPIQAGEPIAEPPIALGEPILDRLGAEAGDWQFADEVGEELIIRAPELDIVRWSTRADLPTDQPAYYVQATMRLLSTTDYYRLGIGVNGVAEGTFILYAIDHTGRFLFESVNNWERTAILPSFQPASIRTEPGAANTLGLLVIGSYYELYLNGEFVTAAVYTGPRAGEVRLMTFTFADSDSVVEAAFDDFAYLPLTPAAGTLLASDHFAVWGETQSTADINARPLVVSDSVARIAGGQPLAVLGRTGNSQMLYAYARGGVGWIPARKVTLALDGAPFPIEQLPIVAPAVMGVKVQLWPVIWPDENATNPDAPTPPIRQGPLAYGQTISVEDATGNVPLSWSFLGSQGDQIVIGAAAKSTALDLALTLYGIDGAVLAEDDDSGTGANPLLRAIVLPADGLYTVEVRTVRGAGGFDLTLDRVP